MSIDFSYVVKFQEKVCTGSGGENRCGFLGAYPVFFIGHLEQRYFYHPGTGRGPYYIHHGI
ncbi:hypothetical protein, partial [Thiolapillus sp.]|uniref:hypothetical protein n=1 Tax=Thiolapillus sp. TaxID=2017437 RepID=UPI003AF75603